MKKIVVLLAALAPLAAVSPADAQSDVAAARVNPDPGAVRAYWTPARMANAIPRDTVQRGGPVDPAAKPGGGGGGGGGGTTSSPSTALAVTWLGASPDTYTNGKVFFHDGSFDYVCSGTAVQSNNHNVVWTAGHCVADGGQNTWVTKWTFVPAYKSSSSWTNPQFPATNLYTSTSWYDNGSFGGDFGAAAVGTAASGATLAATISPSTGRPMSFTPNTTADKTHEVHLFGYPAEGKFTGQTLYKCDTYVQYIDGSDMGAPCELNGGSSGGAWLDAAGNQVSNNSYTYRSLKNVMFGPLFGPTARDVHDAADQATPPPSDTTHN